MKVQVSLTPNEAKRLIAEALASLPEIKTAFKEGKIFLKGGSTVSALAEKLAGFPLRLSGRISPRGTLAAVNADMGRPHSLLIEKGKPRNVDDCLLEAVRSLGRGDAAVIGANLVDAGGNAAMMAGSEGGGAPGAMIAALSTEGAAVFIAAGLEKLVPGTVREAVGAAGRKTAEKALGMAVGLMPLSGRLVTELDAFSVLFGLRAVVIGKGGILGGEGSASFVLEGPPGEAERAFAFVRSLKGAAPSGTPDSFEECTGPNPRCALHLACVYKAGKNPAVSRPDGTNEKEG